MITCLWSFWKHGEIFDFDHSLGSLPYYFKHYNQSSRQSLSFQLADFLSSFTYSLCFNAPNTLGAKANGTGKDQKLTKYFLIDLTFYQHGGLTSSVCYDPTFTPSHKDCMNCQFLKNWLGYSEEHGICEFACSPFKFRTI